MVFCLAEIFFQNYFRKGILYSKDKIVANLLFPNPLYKENTLLLHIYEEKIL